MYDKEGYQLNSPVLNDIIGETCEVVFHNEDHLTNWSLVNYDNEYLMFLDLDVNMIKVVAKTEVKKIQLLQPRGVEDASKEESMP